MGGVPMRLADLVTDKRYLEDQKRTFISTKWRLCKTFTKVQAGPDQSKKPKWGFGLYKTREGGEWGWLSPRVENGKVKVHWDGGLINLGDCQIIAYNIIVTYPPYEKLAKWVTAHPGPGRRRMATD